MVSHSYRSHTETRVPNLHTGAFGRSRPPEPPWRLLGSSEQEPGVVGIGSGGDDVPLASVQNARQSSEETDDASAPIDSSASCGTHDRGGCGPAVAKIKIHKIRYDPPGADYASDSQLRAEYIVIRNTGNRRRQLQNWVVKDQDGHGFKFPGELS